MSCRRDAQPERAFHASPTGRVLNGVSKLRDRRYHQVFSALLLPTWARMARLADPVTTCLSSRSRLHPPDGRPTIFLDFAHFRPALPGGVVRRPTPARPRRRTDRHRGVAGHVPVTAGGRCPTKLGRTRPMSAWLRPPAPAAPPSPVSVARRVAPSLAHVTAAHAGRSSGYRA